MGEIRYNEIKLTVEDIASILYGVDVGKRAKDGSVVVLKLHQTDLMGIEKNERNESHRC